MRKSGYPVTRRSLHKLTLLGASILVAPFLTHAQDEAKDSRVRQLTTPCRQKFQ